MPEDRLGGAQSPDRPALVGVVSFQVLFIYHQSAVGEDACSSIGGQCAYQQ
jgi:hypothetical protein